jgi:hypothetical protein
LIFSFGGYPPVSTTAPVVAAAAAAVAGDIINKNVVAAYWLKCDITLSQFCRNKTPLPRQQSKWKNKKKMTVFQPRLVSVIFSPPV